MSQFLDVIQNLCPLLFALSQDSVLEPVLFRIYTKLISDLIAKHPVSQHSSVDDTQLTLLPISATSIALLKAFSAVSLTFRAGWEKKLNRVDCQRSQKKIQNTQEIKKRSFNLLCVSGLDDSEQATTE